MEITLGMFIIAVVIIAVVAYIIVWALVSDFFVKEGTTNEVDVWKTVITVIIFAIVVVALSYWGSREYIVY